MDIEVVVVGGGRSDDVRALRAWLSGEPVFAGRVRLHEARVGVGAMGPVADAVVVALAGGTGVALAAATVRTLGNVVVTWLRSHSGPLEVTVRRADGAEVTLSAEAVRGLSANNLARLLDDLTGRLASPPAAGTGEPPPDGDGDGPGPAS